MPFNWNNLSGVKPAGEWHKGVPGGWWCCHGVQSSRHNMDPPACRFTFLSECDSLKGMPMPLTTLDVIGVLPRTALLLMQLALPLVNHPPALNRNGHRSVNYSLFQAFPIGSGQIKDESTNWTCSMIIWDTDLYWSDSFALSFSWLRWPWREIRLSGVWFGLFVHKFSFPPCPS